MVVQPASWPEGSGHSIPIVRTEAGGKVMRQPAQQQRASQRPSQPTQGQEKPVLEFFHKSSEDKYKKFVLAISPRGGVIIRLSEKREDGVRSIVFSLSRTEMIALSKEVDLYLSGLVEGYADAAGRGYVIELFHASPNGQYKKLSVDIFKDGGLALVLRQGEKGAPADSIVFSLSRAEAIHLAEELKLLFYKGV